MYYQLYNILPLSSISDFTSSLCKRKVVRVGLWAQDTSGACIPVKEQCRCILMFQLLHVKSYNLSGCSITIIHINLWLKISYFIIVQSCCEIVLMINMYGLWYRATFVAYNINVHWNTDTWAHFFLA